jgi:thymidine phosphorylase
MTAVQNQGSTVVAASAADVRKARARALRVAGLTLDELESQARTGHFDTIEARLAWIAISGIEAV